MLNRPYTDDPNPKNQALVDTFPLGTGVGTEKQLAFFARGLIVDNLTNQWIFIREVFAFVPPYISGRQIPLTGTQKLSIVFSSPTGFTQQPSIAGQSAFFRATAAPVGAAPGVPVAPASVSWAISNFAAVGVQASVTKAASPGISHVFDAMAMAYVQTAATVGIKAGGLIDGASGGTIVYGKDFDTDGVAGHVDNMIQSVVNYKGPTPGNAATIEFSSGQAGYQESVSATGHDA